MYFLSGKAMPRRQFLQGMSATIALPYLDAMIRRVVACSMPRRPRASWPSRWCTAPPAATVGREDEHVVAGRGRSPVRSLADGMTSLENYRDYLTIVSNTDVREAEPTPPNEIGGDHFRSSAVYLTHMHPKQTEGSDVKVGTSLDQLYAQRYGQNTPIPSMQLCIENVDQAGGCAYGYACVYTDSISWASPSEPLPVIRDPRVAFEKLFGVGGTSTERAERRRTRRSILDFISGEMSSLKATLGPEDKHRLDKYLTDIREVERRIQRVEARNTSGEVRELPEARAGVADSVADHVQLMFDISAGVRGGHHACSRSRWSRRLEPHVSGSARTSRSTRRRTMAARSVACATSTRSTSTRVDAAVLPRQAEEHPEGDANMLDKTMIIYGSPMGDSNLHNHRRCPLIVMGKAENRLTGNLHIKAPDGTPMANAMLSMMHTLGMEDMTSFGDSNGVLNLNSANA